MSNKKTTALATRDTSIATYTPEQVELIKNTVAKGASDNELQLFLAVAKRSGLDPFSKQIHFVKRGGIGTIQTGIDGYRAIAERSGSLAGIDDAVYDTEAKPNPTKASVTVYRFINGNRVSFTASARWNEYNCGTPIWKKMPYLMLAKCAEALALRKAFPNDLSGLYTNEEMQQADYAEMKVVDAKVKEPTAPTFIHNMTVDQKKTEIKNLVTKLKPDIQREYMVQYIIDETTLDPRKDENLTSIIEQLRSRVDAIANNHIKAIHQDLANDVDYYADNDALTPEREPSIEA